MTNMQKELMERLRRYQALIKSRMEMPLSAKQARRPASFKRFLANELEAVTAKLDELKLIVGGK